jgi:hypothetical protein
MQRLTGVLAHRVASVLAAAVLSFMAFAPAVASRAVSHPVASSVAIAATDVAPAAVTMPESVLPHGHFHFVGPKRYFLALGDSLAYGYQPNFDFYDGYNDDFYAALQANYPDLLMYDLSCPGETSGSYMHDTCPHKMLLKHWYLESQMQTALNFINDHPGEVSPVTLDMGANDVLACINATTGQINLVCVKQVFKNLAHNLPIIYGSLVQALHGQGDLMITDYYDPFIKLYPVTLYFTRLFNKLIETEAARFNIPVINILPQFTDSTICQYTWMCSVYVDIHATDTGYAVIASDFEQLYPYAAHGAVHVNKSSAALAAAVPGMSSGVLPNVQASGNAPDTQPVTDGRMAVNPGNPMDLLVTGNDYNCELQFGNPYSGQGIYASTDGGMSWSHTCLNTLANNGGCGDADVGYGLNGVAYATGVDCQDQPGAVVFATSTDNGVTWSQPAVAVNALFPNGLVVKDRLAIDTNAGSPYVNTIYISATQFNQYFGNHSGISVSHSTDGGMTWITTAVDPEATFPVLDNFSDLAIGSDGTVYVAWMRCRAVGSESDCGGAGAVFLLSKSTDGGNTWSAPVVITTVTLVRDTCYCGFYGILPNTTEPVTNYPVIGIDNSAGPYMGHLYVAGYTWTGKYMEVGVATSTDGGNTWSKLVPVAPSPNSHDQFFPWLSVSVTGTVGVTWLDRRNDPSNISYQTFAAVSTDGGASFSAPRILTNPASALSNPNNDGLDGHVMGDYTGNVWDGATLYAAWMDSRNGATMQTEVGGYTCSAGCRSDRWPALLIG